LQGAQRELISKSRMIHGCAVERATPIKMTKMSWLPGLALSRTLSGFPRAEEKATCFVDEVLRPKF
jgi:hypothetical protein